MNKGKESGYIDYIVNKKFDRLATDWSFITEESKNEIDGKAPVLVDFLKANSDFENYDEAKKDALFTEAQELLESYKASVKAANCVVEWQGSEIKFVKDRLEDHVEYDAGSVFLGIHLKGTWLNKLVYNLSENNIINIGISDSVVLYELISKTTVKGLKENTYIFAKVLKQLAECSKIYQHYDNETNRLHKAIVEWNMGLSSDDKDLVKKAMLQDAMKNVEGHAQN